MFPPFAKRLEEVWREPRAEMVKYCGGTYRVAKRARRIFGEKTGKNAGIFLYQDRERLLPCRNNQKPAPFPAQHVDLLVQDLAGAGFR